MMTRNKCKNVVYSRVTNNILKNEKTNNDYEKIVSNTISERKMYSMKTIGNIK